MPVRTELQQPPPESQEGGSHNPAYLLMSEIAGLVDFYGSGLIALWTNVTSCTLVTLNGTQSKLLLI